MELQFMTVLCSVLHSVVMLARVSSGASIDGIVFIEQRHAQDLT